MQDAGCGFAERVEEVEATTGGRIDLFIHL